MSHTHRRPLTDRQSVLQVFTKHVKSQKDLRAVPERNPDNSRAKRTARSADMCKVKRLKSRKERSQMRGRRGQSHTQPQCCHQVRRENKREHCHNYCHSRPLRPPPKDSAPTKANRGQETSIITDGRLIGHRGLFNHEVKSVDIERLVSDMTKSKRDSRGAGFRSACGTNSSSAAPPSLLPPSPRPEVSPDYLGVSNLPEEARRQESAERAQSGAVGGLRVDCGSTASTKTHTSGDSEEKVVKVRASIQDCVERGDTAAVPQRNAKVYAGGRSCSTPVQRASRLAGLCQSSDSEPELLSSSASSRGMALSQRDESPSWAGERNQVLPGPDAAGSLMGQRTDLLQKSTSSGCAPQRPQKDIGSAHFPKQLHERHSTLTGPAVATGGGSTKSMEGKPSSGTIDCAAVAARLCQALELPLLCRRHLLAETREALLQVLQERHGLHLEENFSRLQQRLQTEDGRAAVPVGREDPGKESNSDALAHGDKEDAPALEHPRSASCRPAPSKRRRKQLFPQRVEPRPAERRLKDTAVQWTERPVVVPADDSPGEFTKTLSPPLVMDFPPLASPPLPVFTASAWGAQPEPDLSRDRSFRKGPIPNSRCSPELRQPEDIATPSFLNYSAMPPTGDPRDTTPWPSRHAVNEIRTFCGQPSPPLPHRSLAHFHLPTHSSTQPPYPDPWSYRRDMGYYPQSDMLERALSPPLPLLPLPPSPDRWSFPRMRLY
ncbi:hypothetical protein JZ751_028219 [Albula glossodonta]|uniref:Uncharacterized protein n=1 Tax=Albula glossodonta TaxID=121402 RepID=A0A8T2NJ87_9TELE|nr:hypothetical protein JZ751_028219 [Albula glossodonta]